MGWESTHGGQDGPTLPTAASFFSLYRYCRFYTVVQDFWWVLVRVVCGGAGQDAGGEERRVHLLGAEATLLRDVLHSERCSALVYP